jgi:predicted nucleic acid-binding protein
VIEEAESRAAWRFLEGGRWISSEVVLTEIPRGVRNRAATDSNIDLELSLSRSEVVLQEVNLQPAGRLTLWRAGRSFEPRLRSFDAVHVMTALEARPIDAFVTYDTRQAKVARDVGLNVRSPGT